MPSCIKKDTESSSSICLRWWMRHWQAGLIVSAALQYKRDYRWQLRLLIKVGTLKKTEEPCSQRTTVSSHQAPARPFPYPTFTSAPAAPSIPCLPSTPRQGVRAVESGKWHHKNLPAVLRLIMSAAACLVSGFPQASCDPALVSAHQDSLPRSGGKEGEKKINRMFFHLVNWQHRLLERCLSKRSVWKGFRLAERRIGKWKHGELLSLDEVSELPRCSAWVSRKHLRCDRRTSMEECLIKKLWRLWRIVFLGWSEYLCLYVCICVHTVYNYLEHPSSRKWYKSCPLFLPEPVCSLPEWDTASRVMENLLYLLGKSSSRRSGPLSAHLDRERGCLCKECFWFSFHLFELICCD